MAVVSITENLKRDTEFSADRRGGFLGEVLNRRYTRTFWIVTDSVLDDGLIIGNTFGVPKVGDTYKYVNSMDKLATCVNVQIKQHPDNKFLWELTASYDTSRFFDLVQNNPLNVPPEISWDGAEYNRVMVRDSLGVPAVNSSKEWFDPPIEEEDSRTVLTIVRNEATFNENLAIAYRNACNSDVFCNLAVLPRQAQIKKFSGRRAIDAGMVYWTVTYEIHFRRETFDLFVLDQGFRDIDKKLFRDPIDFTPLSNATLLNGRGRRLTDATTNLVGNVGINDLIITIDDESTFPPGANGPRPHWYFEIKVDDEVMQVVNSAPSGADRLWQVIRGYAGTVPATHSNGAVVTCEPYYLRFLPKKVLPFALLKLPKIHLP
jgi:hypothetical protein